MAADWLPSGFRVRGAEALARRAQGGETSPSTPNATSTRSSSGERPPERARRRRRGGVSHRPALSKRQGRIRQLRRGRALVRPRLAARPHPGEAGARQASSLRRLRLRRHALSTVAPRAGIRRRRPRSPPSSTPTATRSRRTWPRARDLFEEVVAAGEMSRRAELLALIYLGARGGARDYRARQGAAGKGGGRRPRERRFRPRRPLFSRPSASRSTRRAPPTITSAPPRKATSAPRRRWRRSSTTVSAARWIACARPSCFSRPPRPANRLRNIAPA